MSWLRRKPPAAPPTPPGTMLGIRPGGPGYVEAVYSCGHKAEFKSQFRVPDWCQHQEHAREAD